MEFKLGLKTSALGLNNKFSKEEKRMVSTNNGGGLSAADIAAVMGSNECMHDGASTDHERQIVDKWIKKMRAEEV